MDLIDCISQAAKTNDWNLIRRSHFHRRFFMFNYCGITALHQASYDNVPVDILQTIIRMNSKAAYVQERQYNCTPLHWAVKNNNLDNVKALLQAAPQAVLYQDKVGNTPLFYSFHWGDPTLIQLLRQSTPSSYNIMKENRRLFLELICSRFQRSIKNFMDGSEVIAKASPEELLEMSAIYCNKQYKIKDLYEIILILLSNQYIEFSVNDSGNADTISPWMKEDNFWIVLQTSLQDNVCQWVFCELILRLHPQHELIQNKSEMTYSHLFEQIGKNVCKAPYNWCNVCGTACNRIFWEYQRDFMVCDKCARCHTMNRTELIGVYARDEEMERVQFIYCMLSEYPMICALICWERC